MTDVHAEAGPSTLPVAVSAKTSNIPVRLTSRTDRHAIPESKYMVPSDWRRFQLSELINKVLGNTQNVPFDFIVGEELLRSTLSQFTQAKGLTEETILEIEYVESILPPKYLSSFQHEDWVSDVDSSMKGHYLTSSYDSNVRIFSSSGTGLQHTLSGHTLPVLSTCWLPSSSNSRHVASGGMDRVIRVWQVPAESSASATSEAINTHALSLHTGPVSSVRSAPSSSTSGTRQILSAGWDGLVGYWELDPSATADGDDIEEAEEAQNSRNKKRRKGVNGSAATTGHKVTKVQPTLVLPGHTGQVSRAIFSKDVEGGSATGKKAYSFGLDDHSVREWDLDAGGVQTSIKQSDKAIMAGDQMASPNLLVTGNGDRSVCIWDLRENNSIISMTLQGHTSSVSAVAAHPTSPLLLCSASYDSTVRIWDARSPKQALFSVQRQKKAASSGTAGGQAKILCTAWDGEMVASGGEDGRLELLQSKGMQ